MEPLVSINIVVRNGQKYIRPCLKSVFDQTYANIEVIVFDNDSIDQTALIVQDEFPAAKLIRNDKNYNFGGGQNQCLKISQGEYIIALCADVVLDREFVKKGIVRLAGDKKIGALQAKIFNYDFVHQRKTDIIDTTGFLIYKSRRIINRGHGEIDGGQFNEAEEIFSYEGACGFFRRAALESVTVDNQVFDESFIWYVDDVDLGWRLTLFGWINFYDPTLIAWHDRSTTKSLKKGYFDFVRLRKSLPAFKKRYDYANQRLMLIKNDFVSLLARHFFHFLAREIQFLCYCLIFEQTTLLSLVDILRLAPLMYKRRKIIMSGKKVSTQEMAKWFL